MNRKKRSKRGIESIKEQIKIHKEKKKKAEKEGLSELVGYYEKEIFSLEEAIKKKEKVLDK